jgi:hypothetical protein
LDGINLKKYPSIQYENNVCVCACTQMCLDIHLGGINLKKYPSIQCEYNMPSSARINQVLGFGDEAISKILCVLDLDFILVSYSVHTSTMGHSVKSM